MSLAETEIHFTTRLIDSAGKISESPGLSARQAGLPLGGGQTLELVRVPEGSCFMGSPRGQGYPDEQPQHYVRLRAFWMGRSPITQAQWQAVMGKAHVCRFHDGDLPVETVSWEEASRFCEKLSARAGLSLHLPGEAQWEYACRAGTQTAFHCGPTIHSDLANYNGMFAYHGGPRGVYRHSPNPAGTYPPNAFGLFDMHGNLWEWCADIWHDDYGGAPVDETPWLTGAPAEFRVARGGSWHDIPDVCRSAARLKIRQNEGDELSGFRVVMDPA